jgi:uncharacterized membrane protein YgdD (TMEM256/DUF423 family)
MKPRTAQLWGAVLALAGVVLGAFGAHALKPLLLRNQTLDGWQVAVHYQWFHALALLAVSRQVGRGPAVCWLLGTFFFSGSLYLLTTNPDQKWAGPVTPLGGLLFIVGWIWFIVSVVRRGEQAGR